MGVSKEHLKHIMLYNFKQGNSAAEATRNIHSVYGEVCLNERSCRRWFAKFKNGDFSLKERPRIGRPVEFNDEFLLSELKNDNSVRVEKLANKLISSHSIVHCHLQQLGKMPKLGKWVPHDLIEANRKSQVNISSSLHSRERISPVLDRLATGDEKTFFFSKMLSDAGNRLVVQNKLNHNPKKTSMQNRFFV
ncbi:histone-lysine N-methyltransferase SETMAR-like [Octopus bimaculoides]|uniref:histone-lysine N-methyltransferase SETMAR-like n=1 Tax=Octopus bimaculoides TaxID=37653 RepID=UPI00071D5CCC|nr:histone-lysine N-methyltransferase SETMAR-like [Octopus bimaculoides]|eukprot:XP_014768378.1 PREDICTED: histone-lysine N-methyltransferase SETMAR-like [Octopus bimaculoides]